MSTSVALIGGCALLTAAIKGVGPVALGGRELADWFSSLVVLLAPALLAALVATQTFTTDERLVIDERAAGLGAAAVAVALRAPILVTVVAAAVVTGALRALS